MQLNIYDKNAPAAVKAYQQSVGLKADGIVGINTWKSLGLIYREKEDINAGVKITTRGLKQYFDISIPVTNAVINAKETFSQHSGELDWFKKTVGDKGDWNIKRNAGIWSKTLGISENSYNKPLIFYDKIVVMDNIGNITYGYLGKAANLSDKILMIGSMANHIKNHYLSDFKNEFDDEEFIQLGIDWYNGKNIREGLAKK